LLPTHSSVKRFDPLATLTSTGPMVLPVLAVTSPRNAVMRSRSASANRSSRLRPTRSSGWRKKVRSAAEDALKHAYDCQSRSVACTIESVAGVLQTSIGNATRIVSRVEAMGLVRHDGTALQLTANGASYALRVIRIHRLWERYLADETSVREADWHREAERQEHRLSAADADALAARLSNPQVDPHGDPIPSATGELPPLPGTSLTSLAEGEFGRIVHIEDEPPEIYAQLAAQGLHPGMELRVIESMPERIRFEAQGEEVLLAPLFARHITVTALPEERRTRGPFLTLASIRPGTTAVVTAISRACRRALTIVT